MSTTYTERVDPTPVAAAEIREAVSSDLPAIIAMAASFISSTEYRAHIKLNPAQLSATASRLISSPDSVILLAERDGGPVGMLALFTYPHPLSGERFACEVAWWVNPEYRGVGLRLLRAGEHWARDHGAEVMQMIAPTPDIERLYERLGFTAIERHYHRRLA